MELLVIAEGVETEQEMAYLKEQGCAMAQGYLFDFPMKHEDLLQRLNETTAS